ncbi:MAG: SPOR domain-containing protein [Roseomonas sp.]|nr:SPOR domain-containing protein [Roseomonas sp.]MCA3318721.1 SPOR domain-containing protein [Roseomonas sp.]
MTRWGILVAAVLAMAGCTQPEPRYVVGDPYRLGGVWSYPQEDYALAETGLAEVLSAPMFGAQTANGEVLTAQGLTAAHRSLQLPAIIRVTNLENGRSMLLRVNDRGPEKPGRILGVSPRAGALLGMAPGRATQIALVVDPEMSRAVAEGLPGHALPPIAIAAAPRAAVLREELAPLPGTREAPRREVQPLPTAAPVQEVAPVSRAAIAALPEAVTQGTPRPGRLFVDVGQFSQRDIAARVAARLPGARVTQQGSGRSASFRVALGPFADLAGADSALERTLASGVSGARIIVE